MKVISIIHRARTKELAEEVRVGSYQQPAFDAMQSFFPPRALIKKDLKAIEEIYGDGDEH